MGMNIVVTFPNGQIPSWPLVVETMAQQGMPLQMRMIDNELAFPDETPMENWQELRVSWSGAMVTLRRSADRITLVTWGNADAMGLRLWETLGTVLAQVGNGTAQRE